jgi:hypothetical protein
LDTIKLDFDRKTNLYGHNDQFRTKVRRILRDTLGFSQRHSQEWAENADYLLDWASIRLCCNRVCKALTNWNLANQVVSGSIAGSVFALNPKGMYRYSQWNPDIIKDSEKYVVKKFLLEKLKDSPKLNERFPNHRLILDIMESSEI